MLQALLLAAALGPAETPPVQRPAAMPPPADEPPKSDEEREEPAEPLSSGPEPLAAPPGPSPPTGDARPWRRKGLMFAASVGVTHCFQAGCDARGHLDQIKLRASPLFRFELGYRPTPYFAALLSGMVAYHPMKVQEAGGFTDAEAHGVRLNIGPALYAFPLRKGRIDPYVSVFAGYVQYRIRLEETRDGARWAKVDVYDRGVVRIGAGLSVHMTPTTAFGIRFDQNLPFAGTHCQAVQPVPTSTFRDYAECTSVRDAAFEDRQGLPFFYEVSIHAIETFDVVQQTAKRRQQRARRRARRRQR